MAMRSFPVRWRLYPYPDDPLNGFATWVPTDGHVQNNLLVVRVARRERDDISFTTSLSNLYSGSFEDKPEWISWSISPSSMNAVHDDIVDYYSSFSPWTLVTRVSGFAFMLDTVELDDSVWEDGIQELDIYWFQDYGSKGWLAEIGRPTGYRTAGVAFHESELENSTFGFSVGASGHLPTSSGQYTIQLSIDGEVQQKVAPFTLPSFVSYSQFGDQTVYLPPFTTLPPAPYDNSPNKAAYRFGGSGGVLEATHTFEVSYAPAPRVQFRVFDHEGRDTGWNPYYLTPVPVVAILPQDEEFQVAGDTTIYGAASLDARQSWHPEGEITGYEWRQGVPSTLVSTDPVLEISPEPGKLFSYQLIVRGHNTDNIQNTNLNQFGTTRREAGVFASIVAPALEGSVAVHPTQSVVRGNYVGGGRHNEAEGVPAVGVRLSRSYNGGEDWDEFAQMRSRSLSLWHDEHMLYVFGRRYEDDTWRVWRQTDWNSALEEIGMAWDENYFHATATGLAKGGILSLALRKNTPHNGYGDLYSRVSWDQGENWEEPVLVKSNTAGRWAVCDEAPGNSNLIYATNGTQVVRSTDSGTTWEELNG